MKNRDADAGVIVFSRQEKAPTSAPLQPFGSKFVVVLDKDDLDERALRLGIAAARCTVLRQLSGNRAEAVDVDGVLSLVDEGQRVLVARSTVRRFLTQAGNSVDELVDTLDDILRQIAARLRSS